jgi:hypothetical protein
VSETVPNVYFVLDRSGSMSSPFDPTAQGKITSYDGEGQPYQAHAEELSSYKALRDATIELVAAIGSHAMIGAAVLPATEGTCGAGQEVFPLTRGDAAPADAGVLSQVTSQFARATSLLPLGYTPTAATLRALLPNLSPLSGPTSIVLATDGAPNCNPDARCAQEQCLLENGCSEDQSEKLKVPAPGPIRPPPPPPLPSVNCCDPTVSPQGPLMCIDETPTLQVIRDLQAAGVRTYVIGVKSRGLHVLLDDMAASGGTDHAYDANSLADLTSALSDVRRRVLPCDVVIQGQAPPRDSVSLFWRSQELRRDDPNGWTWSGSSSIRLAGEACEAFLSDSPDRLRAYVDCR